tara:strand:- start:927 stop:1544 length:618 start_codon:yes stop_codon:yes gene_type:complete
MSDNNLRSNYILLIQNFIKKNLFFLSIFIILLILSFSGFQLYKFYSNKQILKSSIIFNELKNSQLDFNKMSKLSNEKNFYGLLASFELINNQINNKNYMEAYDSYIKLLKNKNIDNLYISLISIHSSYNLLDKIDSEKIHELISYYDNDISSFKGYHLEILYLLSIIEEDSATTSKLYKQISQDNKISNLIKERVRKINDFEKYK